MQPVNVFLSWSGPLSHDRALELHDWLPSVIPAISPLISSEDIEKRKVMEPSTSGRTREFGGRRNLRHARKSSIGLVELRSRIAREVLGCVSGDAVLAWTKEIRRRTIISVSDHPSREGRHSKVAFLDQPRSTTVLKRPFGRPGPKATATLAVSRRARTRERRHGAAGSRPATRPRAGTGSGGDHPPERSRRAWSMNHRCRDLSRRSVAESRPQPEIFEHGRNAAQRSQ